MPNTPITREQFRDLTRPLLGMPVSHAWRGYGSAIFLELSELSPSGRKRNNPDGAASLMVQWSWRVESPGAIRFGSWSTEAGITKGVASLVGHTILDIEVVGRLPELVLTLDRRRWLHTFMTAEGQPEWSIRLLDDTWVNVRRGLLQREGPWRE